MSKSHPRLKKPELLSPAGSVECFFAAVENGADAVYLGLDNFSARAGAQNFSLDDASKVISYAHERSVKVYIAFNTLLKTGELEKVVDYLIALEEMKPDALILQDLGLLYLIQSQFPGFTLHASTQMAIHNLAGVQQLEKLNFKRVVLARELSIDEITYISQNSSVEIEVFVHGALCYSYSGLCFFSSMMGGRSGNRGRCAQPCRMHYKSDSGTGGYLFSMNDLFTLPHIYSLINAGVHTCKIEGRMKSPEYVAVVTDAYRQAIDGKLQDYDAVTRRIKTVFSRKTTHSYLIKKHEHRNEKDIHDNAIKPADMVNPAYPANMGSYAGEVIGSGKGHITIKADTEIGIRDLLQVFEHDLAKPTLLHVKTLRVKGKKVFGIKAGDIATIDTERQYVRDSKLYVLSSQKVHEIFGTRVPKKLTPSRIPVHLEVKIRPGTMSIKGVAQYISCPPSSREGLPDFPFLKSECRGIIYSKDYLVSFEKGIHRITQEKDIKECFSRLGKTPFTLANIYTNIPGGLFIPHSIVNDIRRDYFLNLSEIWKKSREQRGKSVKEWIKNTLRGKFLTSYHHLSDTHYPPPFKRNQGELKDPPALTTDEKVHLIDAPSQEDEIQLSVKVDKLDYLHSIPLKEIYKIYISLTNNTFTHFSQSLLKNEELKGAHDKIVFSLPAVIRDKGDGSLTFHSFKKIVNELVSRGFKQFQISNIGAVGLFEGKDVLLYADYPLYCLNPLSAIQFKKSGFCRYTLSPEDDNNNLKNLFSRDADMILYQDTPLFTSEACIRANRKGICQGKNQCGFQKMIVENEYGDRFIAMNDECRTVVINKNPFSVIHYIPKLCKAGQVHFRVDLCYKDYTPEMIQNIFLKIRSRSKIKNTLIGNFERGLL
ncbi:MAG: U32 family peptidase [wastewater metagenome]|nr:U32 family peptidase [Candidatus Loosdrechtia aerotolerans]